MTGPRARDPQPGDPDYGEHLARRIERCILVAHGKAFLAHRPQSRALDVARAIVAMPEVRALLDQATRPAAEPTVTILVTDAERAVRALREVVDTPNHSAIGHGPHTVLDDIADLLTPGSWGAPGTPFDTVRRRVRDDLAAEDTSATEPLDPGRREPTVGELGLCGGPPDEARWTPDTGGDEYAEALRWFQERPSALRDIGDERFRWIAAERHAATIVRAALAGAHPAPADGELPDADGWTRHGDDVTELGQCIDQAGRRLVERVEKERLHGDIRRHPTAPSTAAPVNVEHLSARVAELEGAGNTLAVIVGQVATGPGIAMDAVQAWRSAVGGERS